MARHGLEDVRVADRQLHWTERLPPRLQPFAVLARLDRPIGTWLLLLPCWWSTALAPGPLRLDLFLLFAIGAVVMRGAGCVVNDLWDRDLDARVERTRRRPLASGAVSVVEAFGFILLLSAIGLVVLLQLDAFAILVGFASVPLIVVYPLMKRVTWWPQAFLGITFNWGALVGWAAVTGELAAAPLLLYAAGFFWTLGYDTIYAHQDKVDDALVGVRSSARYLGDRTPRWLWVFYGVTLGLLTVGGAAAGSGIGFYLGLLAVLAHFVWQVRTLEPDDPRNCLARFRSNRDAGLLVLAAILLGRLGGW
ncbi:MAG: 4-hydroxybenzoate octaprenyltransferase [Geminicoccaceae bacterium]|nr:4-hydroxybenzoate octaprenyltransferase [Geminicoccaceae bacterium]